MWQSRIPQTPSQHPSLSQFTKLKIPSSPLHAPSDILSTRKSITSKVSAIPSRNLEVQHILTSRESFTLSSRNTISPSRSANRKPKLSIDFNMLASKSSINGQKYPASAQLKLPIKERMMTPLTATSLQRKLPIDGPTQLDRKISIKSINDLASWNRIEDQHFLTDREDVFMDLFELQEGMRSGTRRNTKVNEKLDLETSIVTTEADLSEREGGDKERLEESFVKEDGKGKKIRKRNKESVEKNGNGETLMKKKKRAKLSLKKIDTEGKIAKTQKKEKVIKNLKSGRNLVISGLFTERQHSKSKEKQEMVRNIFKENMLRRISMDVKASIEVPRSSGLALSANSSLKKPTILVHKTDSQNCLDKRLVTNSSRILQSENTCNLTLENDEHVFKTSSIQQLDKSREVSQVQETPVRLEMIQFPRKEVENFLSVQPTPVAKVNKNHFRGFSTDYKEEKILVIPDLNVEENDEKNNKLQLPDVTPQNLGVTMETEHVLSTPASMIRKQSLLERRESSQSTLSKRQRSEEKSQRDKENFEERFGNRKGNKRVIEIIRRRNILELNQEKEQQEAKKHVFKQEEGKFFEWNMDNAAVQAHVLTSWQDNSSSVQLQRTLSRKDSEQSEFSNIRNIRIFQNNSSPRGSVTERRVQVNLDPTAKVVRYFDEFDPVVIQPKFMESNGSMCITELWSNRKKNICYSKIRPKQPTTIMSSTPHVGVYRPEKMTDSETLKNKRLLNRVSSVPEVEFNPESPKLYDSKKLLTYSREARHTRGFVLQQGSEGCRPRTGNFVRGFSKH